MYLRDYFKKKMKIIVKKSQQLVELKNVDHLAWSRDFIVSISFNLTYCGIHIDKFFISVRQFNRLIGLYSCYNLHYKNSIMMSTCRYIMNKS